MYYDVQQEELSRKRKAPVASSVVRVNRASDEDSDEVEEEDANYGGRGLSSRVSLPSKPERKLVLKPQYFESFYCYHAKSELEDTVNNQTNANQQRPFAVK